MGRGSHWFDGRAEAVQARKVLERAARDAWGEWLDREIAPTVFGTLTFRPSPRPVSDASAMRAYERFHRRASELLGAEVTAATVNEHTKAGMPHGHPLLSISRAHRKGDRRLLEAAWKKSHRYAGMTRFEKPRRRHDTGRYVGKYVAKEGGGIVFSDGFGRK